MALNIFPRRPEVKVAPMVIEDPSARKTAEPAEKAAPGSDTDSPRRARRGTRGGRSRSRTAAPVETELKAPAAEPEAEAEAAPAPRRRTATRTRTRTAEKAVEAPGEAQEEEKAEPRERPAARRRPPAEPAGDGLVGSREMVRAIEDLSQQVKELIRLEKEHLSSDGAAATRPARVGVFVDVANVELGADRLRARVDWGKVLKMLTRDRQLVRAIAYAPVHDDPTVSRETQRFVEPFLDKGYKITTKPLKRFADGSVKANVDIELALDVITMLDRLDVVCLVSGDGDFEPLVVAAQNRGVRVEVVAVGSSTAGNLRAAADRYIDLQSVLSEIRAS